MKSHIIETPLRTIHLELEDKEPTELEIAGVAAYIQLHNELWKIKQLAEEYSKEVNKVLSIVNDLKEAYIKMETEAKKYGKTAGFTDQDVTEALGDVEPETKVTLKLAYLQSLLNAYGRLADDYNNIRFSSQAVYAEASELRDRFEESFSHFNRHYFTPMLNDWANLQIHTVSLDDDFNKFRELSCQVDEMYDRSIDEWDSMCEDVNDLTNKVHNLNKHISYLSGTINAFHQKAENSELN